MHEFTKIAVDLKKKGYPQALIIGETYYDPLQKSYVKHTKAGDPPKGYVRVPTLVNILGKLTDLDFELKHYTLEDEKELWVLKYDDTEIKHETLAVVMAKFWMAQKGKK